MISVRKSSFDQNETLAKTTKDILNEIQACVQELDLKEVKEFNGEEPRQLQECYNKLAALPYMSLNEDDSKLWHHLYQCVCMHLAQKYLATPTEFDDESLDKNGNESEGSEEDLNCSDDMPLFPDFGFLLQDSNTSICGLEEVSNDSNSSFDTEFFLGGDEVTAAEDKAKELKKAENPSLRPESRSRSRSRSRSPRSSNSLFQQPVDDNYFIPLANFGIDMLDEHTNTQEIQPVEPLRMIF